MARSMMKMNKGLPSRRPLILIGWSGVMVDEPEVALRWIGVVEGAVAKFEGDSAEEQEVICVKLGEEYGLEAAEKARELFKAARAKLKPVDGAPKPEPQEPEPEDEEEKKTEELRTNVAGKPSFK